MTADHQLLGYFDHAEQAVPEYDPGTNLPCPLCGSPLRAGPMRTISIMWQEGAGRSLFYRVHQDCHNALTAKEEGELDERFFRAAEFLP